MDRLLPLLTAIAAVLFIGPACRSNDSEPASETAAGKTTERRVQKEPKAQRWSEEMLTKVRQRCPMDIDGAEVEVSDTESGVALLFTTETGDIDDLRQRFQGMASRYQAQDKAHGHGAIPSLHAAVVDVNQGVQLTLTPKNASGLEQIREHVRAHQSRMEAGECWMAAPPDSNSNSSRWIENLFGG
jgi:hypothetical protein